MSTYQKRIGDESDDFLNRTFEEAKQEGHEKAKADIKAGVKIPEKDPDDYPWNDPLGRGYAAGVQKAINEFREEWENAEPPEKPDYTVKIAKKPD